MLKSKPGVKEGEYAKLGRQMDDLLVQEHLELLLNTKRQIGLSFMRGAFAGLGGVLGATVGVALLIYILTLFDGLPVIGQIIKGLIDTINSR